ncbi:MAG: hypothetical protein ACW99A_02380 [Candidatus Kariarchaeaceae archaeon]|jgi:hypothetical protein
MKTFESLETPPELEKMVNDLKKLNRIGQIHSIEIALDREVELNTELINFCRGNGGLIYANGLIFVNFAEVGMENFDEIFTQIYYLGGEMEIEGVLVHMKDIQGQLYYTVEVDSHSYLPSLISISDQSKYLSFLNYIQIRWYSK